jgi:membrane protein
MRFLRSFTTTRQFSAASVFKNTFQRFRNDRCALHARSLSYVSIISLFPLALVPLLFLKNSGMYPFYRAKIAGAVTQVFLPDTVQVLLVHLESMAERARSIGFIGAVISVAVCFFLFLELSRTMNRIWSAGTRTSVAVAVLKFIFLIAVSLTIIVVTFVLQSTVLFEWVKALFPVWLSGGVVVEVAFPLFLHWILLFFVYLFVPHGKKNVSLCFTAGVISGTLWYLMRVVLKLYIRLIPQINALYGSLVFIPLFLLWLYVSWMIVLFGFELNYTFHFRRT